MCVIRFLNRPIAIALTALLAAAAFLALGGHAAAQSGGSCDPITLGLYESGISFGGSWDGRDCDSRYRSGREARQYSFRVLDGPKEVEIVLTSDTVDTYLYLAKHKVVGGALTAELELVAHNDDGSDSGDGSNSRIRQRLDTGLFRIEATTYAARSASTQGSFRLSLRIVTADATPTPGDGGAAFVETLSAGGYHSCGLAASGAVQCWGDDGDGRSSPPSGRFTQVSAGREHTCGLTAAGVIQCWGNNVDGKASPPAGRFTQINVGTYHSCGLTTAGAVQCWGWNLDGQSSPPAGRFVQVSAGYDHTCGLTSTGAVQCWGRDNLGQASPPAGRFAQVSAGGQYTCGLAASGVVQCWGTDGLGKTSPPTSRFTQVSAGFHHACGLAASGAVQCWGYDEHGQSSPPAGRFTRVGGGFHHTCGLTEWGAVQCWGYDGSGQSSPPDGLRLMQGGASAPSTPAPVVPDDQQDSDDSGDSDDAPADAAPVAPAPARPGEIDPGDAQSPPGFADVRVGVRQPRAGVIEFVIGEGAASHTPAQRFVRNHDGWRHYWLPGAEVELGNGVRARVVSRLRDETLFTIHPSVSLGLDAGVKGQVGVEFFGTGIGVDLSGRLGVRLGLSSDYLTLDFKQAVIVVGLQLNYGGGWTEPIEFPEFFIADTVFDGICLGLDLSPSELLPAALLPSALDDKKDDIDEAIEGSALPSSIVDFLSFLPSGVLPLRAAAIALPSFCFDDLTLGNRFQWTEPLSISNQQTMYGPG